MARRPDNPTRGRRVRRLQPKLQMTGAAIGLLVGWLCASATQVIWKQKLAVVTSIAISGVLLGAAFEALRFWWRIRRSRTNKHPNH